MNITIYFTFFIICNSIYKNVAFFVKICRADFVTFFQKNKNTNDKTKWNENLYTMKYCKKNVKKNIYEFAKSMIFFAIKTDFVVITMTIIIKFDASETFKKHIIFVDSHKNIFFAKNIFDVRIWYENWCFFCFAKKNSKNFFLNVLILSSSKFQFDLRIDVLK